MENLVSVKYNVPLLDQTIQNSLEQQCFSNALHCHDTISFLCKKLYSLTCKNEPYVITQLRYLEAFLTVMTNQPDLMFACRYQNQYWHFNRKYVTYWLKINDKWSAQRFYPFKRSSSWYTLFHNVIEEKDRNMSDTRWIISIHDKNFEIMI